MTDRTKTQAASNAAKNAKSILSAAESKSDIDALTYFKDQICSLVSYNEEARDNTSMDYGNPWQLIYVFDGNISTNVVCEGYSKAFKYLCDNHTFTDSTLNGKGVYTVSGQMVGGTGAGAHMWNVVQTSDNTYLVDVTNSDTGTIGSDGSLFMKSISSLSNITKNDVGRTTGYTSGRVTYAYDDDMLTQYDEDEIGCVVAVTGITIVPSETTIAVGGTVPLTATVTPDNATNKTVTWSSDKTGVATVDQNGIVTAVSAGTAEITAKAGNKTAKCTVTVSAKTYSIDVKAYYGTANADMKSAEAGKTVTLTMKPNNGYKLSDVEVTTAESKTTVTVSGTDNSRTFIMPAENVNVYAYFSKTYSITITDSEHGTVKADKSSDLFGGDVVTLTIDPENGYELDKITFADGSETGVVINDNTGTFFMPGENVTLTASFKEIKVADIIVKAERYTLTVKETAKVTATVMPDNAKNKDVTWSSDKPEVAAISTDGTVTAKSVGTAKITATAKDGSGVEGSVEITVKAAEKSITVEETANGKVTADPAKAAQGTKITLTVIPDTGYELESITATAGENIVDLTKGENNTYTFTMPGEDMTVTTTFKKTVVKVAEIKVTADKTELTVGDTSNDTAKVNATIKPDNATNKDVTWSASPEGIVTVDKDGNVTAKAAGTATITATAQDGSKVTGSCTITVNEKNVTYTLKYNANDGSGAPSDQTAENNTGSAEFTVSDFIPTRSGHTFLGWADSVDAKDAAYKAGDKITLKKDAPEKTLYAVWSKDVTYTVTYTDGVDDEEIFKDQVTKDLAAGSSTPEFDGTPTREGYTFNGWDPEVAETVTKDATYTAQWEKNPIAVEKVTLNKTELSLTEEGSEKLTATVTPTNADDKKVTWKSDDTKIASVSDDGTVTAVREGETTITATAGGKSATCKVTVTAKGVKVTGITVTAGKSNLTAGDTTTVTATVNPDNATNKDVTWSASPDNIVTVSADGTVTAKAAGTATITATAKDGSEVTGTCTITVNEKNVTYTLKYNANDGVGAPADQTAENNTGSAEFTVSDSIPARSGHTFLGWADSADAKDAAYKANDTITLKKDAPEKTLYAVWSKDVTYTVTYTDGVDDEEIFKDQVTKDLAAGSSTPEFDGTPTREGYTFNGWDPEVAETVTKDATYTAQWEKNPVAVEEVTLNKTELSLTEGATERLTATVTPDNADDTKVTWKSDDSRIASVESDGTVKAIKAGTTTITATAGGKSATCKLTVTAADVKATGITVTADKSELTAGDTTTVRAVVTPTNATSKHVSWSSDKPGIARVDGNGKVTAVSAGTATITATAQDGSGATGNCEITVTAKAKEAGAGGTATYTAGEEFANNQPVITMTVNGRKVEAVITDLDLNDLTFARSTILNNGSEQRTATANFNGTSIPVTVTVKPRSYSAKVSYDTGKTSYVKGTDKDLLVTSDADNGKFVAVYVDGKEISSDNYKHESGSTKVTLYADYVKTLSDGDHEIIILSRDGKAVTTANISSESTTADTVSRKTKTTASKTSSSGSKVKATAAKKSVSAKTGDSAQTGIWIAVSVIAVVAIVLLVVFRKRKKK